MAAKQILRQISMNSDKKNCLHIYHVEKCLHVTDFTPHFSTWHDFSLYLPCRDISPTEYLSCGGTSPHDNLSYGKFSPHDKFFSTNTVCDVCDKYQVWTRHWNALADGSTAWIGRIRSFCAPNQFTLPWATKTLKLIFWSSIIISSSGLFTPFVYFLILAFLLACFFHCLLFFPGRS